MLSHFLASYYIRLPLECLRMPVTISLQPYGRCKNYSIFYSPERYNFLICIEYIFKMCLEFRNK